MKGRRVVWSGRASIRSVLYMATLSAIRYNKPIKIFYQRLVANGKLKKEALVACMRKLLVILNAMLKKGSEWDPDYVKSILFLAHLFLADIMPVATSSAVSRGMEKRTKNSIQETAPSRSSTSALTISRPIFLQNRCSFAVGFLFKIQLFFCRSVYDIAHHHTF